MATLLANTGVESFPRKPIPSKLPAIEMPLLSLGFMRRFDHEYAQLKSLIDSGELGHPLVLHCVHRNPSVPPHFDSAMTVKDSLVHEVDVTRFLLGEEITSIQVITPTPNSLAAEGLSDPQIAIFKTASGRHVDVELFALLHCRR